MGYDLTRLGWLQFERLCDALVEDVLGVAPADWAGAADVERSVTLLGDVEFGDAALTGPVRIRTVFVRDGTASAPLFARLVGGPRRGDVAELVVTNVQLARRVRAKVLHHLRPRADLLDGAALGALIDERPALRLALPSLIGLRDPVGLEPAGSTLDLDAALALARVFHPTPVYAETIRTLQQRAFAALTGPPEAGKTAAARMVALAKLSDGWQAHECTTPAALWRVFDPARPQVFVADDAFGSTEYSPEAAEHWANELPGLLAALDDRHWLIWTSRPAPLRAGLTRLRREHGLESFPAPSEVELAADELALQDRALILFRHAREAELPDGARRLVQEHGAAVVAHPHFTPERIRRLVAGLPAAVAERLDRDPAGFRLAVESALARPTDAMRGSFAALGADHRALLHAMLDQPPGPVAERELATALRRIAPGAHGDPHRLTAALEEHFLRGDGLRRSWVHPSWRDVAIEALAADPPARAAFLRGCGPDGVALALSVGGGAAGERVLPLLVCDADFDALGDRLGPLLRELDEAGQARLLRTLAAAVEARPPGAALTELVALADRALEVCRRAWEGSAPPVDSLAAWHALAASAPGPPGEVPDPGPAWAALLPADRVDLADLRAFDELAEWIALAGLLAEHEPERLDAYGFPERQREVLGRFVADAEDAADRAPASVRERLPALLRELARLVPGLRADAIAERVEILREPPVTIATPTRDADRFALAADVERILRDLD